MCHDARIMDLQPPPPERRHPADCRDEIEHAEVGKILSVLPEDHPARTAYAAGAREAADSCALTHLMPERRELAASLVEANLAAWRRVLARQGGYFRP